MSAASSGGAATPAAVGERRVLHGGTISSEPRLTSLREREGFLLKVIIPRVRTVNDAAREWMRRTAHPLVWGPCLVVAALHIGMLFVCQTSAGGVCAGGPDDDEDSSAAAFSEYGPPIINALATLLLSFYANVCMELYKEGYFACQQLKESVLDVMAIVVGTIPPASRELRLEFWRVVNLYHLASYVLADKTRQTYSLDNFLIPVATAYGDYDGAEYFGMLRHDELSILHLHNRPALASVTPPPRDATRRARQATRPSLPRRPITSMMRQHTPQHRMASRARSGQAWQHHPQPPPSASADNAPQAPAPRKAGSLINSRGDVQSQTAVLHAALGVRMYALVDLALKQKISQAAWPAWNAVCLKLRANSEALKQRALFRLPRIYQASVRFLVGCALLTDSFLLASHAARLLRTNGDDGAWAAHGYFGAAVDFSLNLMLTWTLCVFLNAISDMQNPFGSETLDMPGLSYACAAAEVTLGMVVGAEEASDGPKQLFAALGHIDHSRLLSSTNALTPRRAPRTKGEEAREGEEAALGDCGA